MEWKLLTSTVQVDKKSFWFFINKKLIKETIDVPTNQQMDEVGNIYQKGGSVIVKACQKCRKKFNYKPTLSKVTQDVPYYKCKDCDFKNAGGDAAFDHKLETSHNIKKTTEPRIVSYVNKILGNVANITKTDNDIIILCDKCVS